MFIELLDGLRCTSDHPQIPLVAAIMQRDGRMVIDGVLGCPTCRREYPIRNGAVWFRAPDNVEQAAIPEGEHDPDGALRAGAFLAASAGTTVALVGDWARCSQQLAELIDLRVYAVNSPAPVEESERVGVLHSDKRLPFADGSLHGVAIDEHGWSIQDLESAIRALVPSGRMVARARVPVPNGIDEIARDERFWVGEKRGALVTLHRR
jgi:uncharacterized protein YbaR (Trm112 family)